MTFEECQQRVSALEFTEWMAFFKIEAHPILVKPKQEPESIKSAMMAIAQAQNIKAKKKAPKGRPIKKKAPKGRPVKKKPAPKGKK